LGKKYKAADSIRQFILQALKSSPYTFGFLPSVVNELFFTKNFFNLNHQSQEEAGNAGGQPASNKAEAKI
jgi:hypothetical protein